MTSLHRKLFRDLWHLRGQMLAVALVVACGIATWVTMRGAYGAIETAQQDYYTRYRFADIFAQLKRAPEALARQIALIPGVAGVQPRIVLEVNLDVPGLPDPALGRVISIPEHRRPILNDLFLLEGRYIEPGRPEEALVSAAFASANKLGAGATIGAVINGRWERLKIVGIALSPEYVYEIRGTEVFPDNRHFGVLWMSREALGPMFNMEGAFNDVSLTLAPGASKAGVIERLDTLLAAYGGLGAYDREEQISHRFTSDEIAQDRITGIFVPAIFLGIAAFLIHIVLSRLITTQRNYIGLLKAFGYSDISVGIHYLEFALIAVLAGTAFGIPLGIWLGRGLARMYQDFFRFPELRFSAGPPILFWAVGISAAAACLGALGGLRSAISLPPAEAMRPESPPRFRRGLAERLGMERFVSLSGRMILRNLERRPWKAVLSALGMACAVAILIIGFYFYDAVEYLVQVEFQSAQRDDVTITFNEPRGAQAKHDVTHLVGVLRAEPFRTVPARLRFGPRSRRIGILGLSPNAELRRAVDRQLQVIPIPPDGLLLSSKLAEILGVSPGDIVTIEVLEGSRPVRRVVVAGLVDQLIGLSAYMDIHGLSRLLREEGSISGANLAVDSRATPALYSLLKQTPSVSGVQLREAMIESFRQTIARSLSISTMALVLFACVIAGAMVYNGARISLSERGQELASLRVLGFTQGEIAVMLLGEQAFLMLTSLPLGFALGYGLCYALTIAMQTELYRMPLVLTAKTYVIAFSVVATASVLTGILIFRRLRRMDLIGVLKTRE